MKEFQPVEFVPVHSVFKAMVKITLRMDVSGWADRSKNQKWAMQTGETHIIDEQTAREFVAKGYAAFTDRDYERRHPISEDEMATLRSTNVILDLGGDDG